MVAVADVQRATEPENVLLPVIVCTPAKYTTESHVGIPVEVVPKSLLKAVPLASLVGCQLESETSTCEAVNTFFLMESQSVAAATTKSPTAGTVPE